MMVKFNTIFLGSVLKSLFFFLFIPLLGLGTTYCEMSDTESLEERDEVRSNTKTTCEDCEVIRVQDPGEGNDIRSNFEAAWDKASASDTILLPAGSFAYGISGNYQSTLLLTSQKPNVHIKGMGNNSNGTRLYRTEETDEFIFSVNGGSSDLAGVEISHIWFQGMETRLFDGDTGTTYGYFNGIELANCDAYIHDCKFQYFSNAALNVVHPVEGGIGVISNNIFTECIAMNNTGSYGDAYSRGYGIGLSAKNMDSWISVSPGTDMFTFIEDNYFSVMRVPLTTAMGGLAVFRYNYCEKNISNSSYVDMHPASPTWVSEQQYSSRFLEVYENTFVGTPSDHFLYIDYVGPAFSFRGGESLIHNNTFKALTNYYGSLEFAGGYDEPGAPSDYTFPDYPVPCQQGYKSGEAYGTGHTGTDPSNYGDGDLFIWNNTFDNSADNVRIESPITYSGVEYDYLKEGRDYHFEARPDYTPYAYPHPRRDMKY